MKKLFLAVVVGGWGWVLQWHLLTTWYQTLKSQR